MSNLSAPSDKTHLICLALRAAVLVGVAAMNAPAQVQQIVLEQSDGTVNDINGFELSHTPFNTSLFWWSGKSSCGPEFRSDARIGSLGTVTYPPKTPNYTLDDCVIAPACVVQDGAYYYYTDNNTGRLYKKALNAKTTDRSTEIPTPWTPLQSPWQFGAMTLYNGRLYWTTYLAGDQFEVYSINPDGTSPSWDVFPGYGNVGVNCHVKKLMGFTRTPLLSPVDGLYMLTDDGNLFEVDINPPTMNPPASEPNWLTFAATDFAIRNESTGHFPGVLKFFTTLYVSYSQGAVPPGEVASMDAGPAGGRFNVLYTASGQYQVTSVALDDNFLFVTENDFSGTVNIRRQANLSGSPVTSNSGWDLILSSALGEVAGDHLQSDGSYLYFLNANTINRVSTSAPAVGLDFAADALEVVQASQDLNQSVNLVANKDTYVRGYAHVALASSIPNTIFYIYARLNGSLNGTALTPIDSPLAGITAEANLDTLRSSLDGTFLFKLPPSWVQPGTLQLTMTINPDQSPPETGNNPLANNSVSLAPVSFTQRGNATLVLVPMRTDFPNYDPNSPSSNLGGILARARSLLPVNDFNWFYQDEQVEKPVVNVSISIIPPSISVIDMDPFEFGGDKTWALIWMAVRNYLSKNPPGNDVHWVGTVPAAASDSWNGIGGASGMNLHELVSWLPPIAIPSGLTFGNTTVVRFNPGPGNFDWESPHGGVTLAHELSHNYGRFHIDETSGSHANPAGCGTDQPASPYQSDYPYDTCTMGPLSGPTAIVGFDPISQEVIVPTSAADTMTYANDSWASGWNWNIIFDHVPDPAIVVPPAGQPRPMSDTQVLLLHGSIDTSSNTATFQTFYHLTSADVDSDKLMLDLDRDANMAPGNPYQFLFLDAGGNPIQTNNVLIFPVQQEEGGPGSAQINFVQFTTFNPLTHRIQLRYNGAVLAERVASPNAPIISITSLSLDSANQLISLAWNATDPDGDLLWFTVQYSADNGASWTALKIDFPWQSLTFSSKLLPGSTTAQLRVLASDGFNTTIAYSSVFSLPKHVPMVTIQGLVPDQRVAYGTAVNLFGLALDAEDGSIGGSGLTWNLSGPTTHSASATPSFQLDDLAPGIYTASLTAIDSDKMSTTASLSFQVLPLVVPESSVPAFDGTGGDPAYANAAQVRVPLTGSRFVNARLIHAGGALYAAFHGLMLSGNSSQPSCVGLRVDQDFTRSSKPQTSDVGFFIDENGMRFQMAGNGTTMPPTLSPLPGSRAAFVVGAAGWTAELMIPDALLGGWNHPAGLMLSEQSVTSPGDLHAWPPSANTNSPATWAPACFGTLPAQSNRPPVALVGPNQFINLAQSRTVLLNGSASYDPDGDALSYQWTQTSGPSVTLSNAASAVCSFVASPVSAQSALTFQLTVSDGSLSSRTNTVVTLLPTQGVLMTFPIWESAFFSSSQLSNPALTGPSADPAHDGVVNLLKYAFNMNPLAPDATAPVLQGSGLPIAATASAYDPATQTVRECPAITFVRWNDASDLTYSVQSSLDLTNWTDQLASPNSFFLASQVALGTHLQLVTVRTATPMSGPGAPRAQFLRVAVTWTGSPPPPTIATLPATLVTSTNATLNGTVLPNGVNVTYWFEYGLNTNYAGSTPSFIVSASNTTPVPVNAPVIELTPSTTYHYRLVAFAGVNEYFGADDTFTTTAALGPPTVTTLAASSVTATSAQLNGTVNPNGASSTVYFEYGTNTTYGNITTQTGVNSAESFNAVLSGLSPSTTYHYRLDAHNTFGMSYGADATFTTTAWAPVPPTLISPGTGTSPGPVLATSTPTFTWTAAGPASSYDLVISQFPSGNRVFSTGVQGTSYQIPSGVLVGGASYSWYMVSYNNLGDESVPSASFYFQTPSVQSAPTVQTLPASSITANSAVLNGSVNPNGSSTTAYFEYGLTTSYGTITTQTGIGTTAENFSATVTGLAPGTTYHYRIDSVNLIGSADGADATFTTTGAWVPIPPTLVSPGSATSPGPTLTTLTPTFTWTGASQASSFDLVISQSPSGKVAATFGVQGTSYQIPSGVLVGGTAYSWYMVSFNSLGSESAHSASLYFQTAPP
jgi:hypothetical protein